jgi:hypothetical protein
VLRAAVDDEKRNQYSVFLHPTEANQSMESCELKGPHKILYTYGMENKLKMAWF